MNFTHVKYLVEIHFIHCFDHNESMKMCLEEIETETRMENFMNN